MLFRYCIIFNFTIVVSVHVFAFGVVKEAGVISGYYDEEGVAFEKISF
jgi:hypothetical protein